MRAWTRQLGFVTGMMPLFFGAIFILVNMSASGTQLNAEGSGTKGARPHWRTVWDLMSEELHS